MKRSTLSALLSRDSIMSVVAISDPWQNGSGGHFICNHSISLSCFQGL